MTITAEELKTLDKAATQGEFGLSDCGNHIFSTDGECIAENGMPDNLEFIVAAVNGVRDGSLVHVDDIDEQELLDEMSSERDEARGQADKLAREFMPKLAAVSLWISFSVDWPDGDKMMEPLDDLCARLAALSQGEDGA